MESFVLEKMQRLFGPTLPARRPYTMLTGEVVRSTLNEFPHLIRVSSGRPFLMYLTRVNGHCTSLFVDRATSAIFPVELNFAHEVYSDTLFEGEFNDSGGLLTLTDTIGWKGQLLDRVNLSKRLCLMHKTMTEMYQHSPTCACDFATARYYHYGELEEAVRAADAETKTLLVFKSFHLKFRDVLYDATVLPPPPPPPPPRYVAPPPRKCAVKKTQKSGSGSGRNSFSAIAALDDVEVVKGGSEEEEEEEEEEEDDDDPAEEDDRHARDRFPVPDGTVKTFWAAKMPRPDTYILYDDACNEGGSRRIAGINTRELSFFMTSFFEKSGHDRKSIECTYSARINRWIPLLGVSPPNPPTVGLRPQAPLPRVS